MNITLLFARVVFHPPIAGMLSKRTRPFGWKSLLASINSIIRSPLICQRSFQATKANGFLNDHNIYFFFKF